MEQVGIGIGYELKYDDNMLEFQNNLVTDFHSFDPRNLHMCKYLNLRHSLFDNIDVAYFKSLEFIDIAFSFVERIDFTKCMYLKYIIADES